MNCLANGYKVIYIIQNLSNNYVFITISKLERLKRILFVNQMSANSVDHKVPPATYVVDDAVGVCKSHWFVAIVNHNSEKQVSEKLTRMGVVNYLPTQTEIRVWRNGRKSKVARIVIPSTVFVYCTEQKRKDLVSLPFIFRFMTNKAGTSKNSINKPLAIIPNIEIERLKFMLGQSDIPVEITEKPFKKGDKVRVIRGDLTGLEGEIITTKNAKSEFIVALKFLGYARLSIDTINLEIIK